MCAAHSQNQIEELHATPIASQAEMTDLLDSPIIGHSALKSLNDDLEVHTMHTLSHSVSHAALKRQRSACHLNGVHLDKPLEK